MILTPQMKRVIGSAIRDLNPEAQRTWRDWAGDDHMPNDVADVALDALRLLQLRLEDWLANPRLGEDVRADYLNDLGYVRAIRQELLGETAPRRFAVG